MQTQQSRRIVVGVDFDVCGDDAIIEAVKLVLSGAATELHAVHVLDPSDVVDHPAVPALVTEEHVLEQAPAVLRARVEEIARSAGVSLPWSALFVHARIGKAVAALNQVAVDYDADLIIVGSHRRRGLDRLLLGSVAQALVREATCPVLVARPKDHSAWARSERPEPAYAPGEEPARAQTPVDRPLHISTERTPEPSSAARIF
jgi:nucleotide-binding universal stress UspA family protein